MKMTNNQIISKSNKTYNQSAKKYGESCEAVLWGNQQTQYFRFYELIRNIDLHSSRKTILDVGCGNGELYKFLNFIGFRGDYTGYDINKMLLILAKKRFKNINVKLVDILVDKQTDKFDFVLMSGLFNRNVGQDEKWIHEFIKKMFALCGEALSFNMISTHVNYQNKEMYYFDPAKMLTFCIKHLSPRVTLSHHNLPYNYTVTVYRDNNWSAI